jgi:HD-GYP domain-containing protein (c-di-GMP phosphodiesterase class II)
MSEHHDALEGLNEHLPLKEKLIAAHASLNEVYPFITRIAVTLYDPKTRVLKTYLNSSEDEDPLEHYQALIDDAPSLKSLLDKGLPRVINNMLTFENKGHEHTVRIGRMGYAASYTLPMFNEGAFLGFIFFNSNEVDVFTDHVLSQIDVYGHMISLMIVNELSTIKTLTAAVKTTGHITHCRDPETGSHLDRMSRYSRLIASEIADKYNLNDEYIEHIFMFSSLHDIGKIAIPDEVLLKPKRLAKPEMELMKSHARKGREMIDDLIMNFGLQALEHVDILRNIAEYHHEAVNGTGYPDGKKRDEIPLEARIVAVADVFDALTSRRPYKEAWSNELAINTLKELAGEKLDIDCVEALINNVEKIEEIQKLFCEDPFG